MLLGDLSQRIADVAFAEGTGEGEALQRLADRQRRQDARQHRLEDGRYAGHDEDVVEAKAGRDGDGVVDFIEVERGTNPKNSDSDGDGLSDGDEIFNHETEPLVEDTDGDGVNDGDEVAAGTDPLSAPVETREMVKEEEGVPGFLFVSAIICFAVVAIINRNRSRIG